VTAVGIYAATILYDHGQHFNNVRCAVILCYVAS